MSQIRLCLDEDFMRRTLVFGLRARSIDVLTAAEADMVNREDEDHLIAASSVGRTIFTYNRSDYCGLHQRWMCEGLSHAGIIVAPQQTYSVGEELRRIMHLISRVTAEDMLNRLEFLTTWA